ncbi:MAG TPA: hypothetical protein PLT28_00090 [Saprospiraceae bacterium]|nr:hypothetical protein [Saprospiraceae bacterium]
MNKTIVIDKNFAEPLQYPCVIQFMPKDFTHLITWLYDNYKIKWGGCDTSQGCIKQYGRYVRAYNETMILLLTNSRNIGWDALRHMSGGFFLGKTIYVCDQLAISQKDFDDFFNE